MECKIENSVEQERKCERHGATRARACSCLCPSFGSRTHSFTRAESYDRMEVPKRSLQARDSRENCISCYKVGRGRSEYKRGLQGVRLTCQSTKCLRVNGKTHMPGERQRTKATAATQTEYTQSSYMREAPCRAICALVWDCGMANGFVATVTIVDSIRGAISSKVCDMKLR
eukprot:1442436-Pleurochrysis_carterae.AAC.4